MTTVFLNLVLRALMTNQLELAFDVKSIGHPGARVVFLNAKFDFVSSLM